MNFIKNLKVNIKLTLAFFIVVLVVIVVGGTGIICVNKTNNNSKNLYEYNIQSINTLDSINRNVLIVKSDVQSLVFDKSSEKAESIISEITQLKDADDKLLKEFASKVKSEDELKILNEFKNYLQDYRILRNNIVDRVKSGKYDQAAIDYRDYEKVSNTMHDSLEKLISLNLKQAQNSYNSNNKIYNSAITYIVAFIVAGALFAVLLGIYMTNDIIVPLNKMKKYAYNLAECRFSEEITITRRDEFGQTAAALNVALKNIRELIKVIVNNSSELSATSEELSATIEEITAKIEIIENSTNEIAKGAGESNLSTDELTAAIHEVDTNISDLAAKASGGSTRAVEIKNKVENISSSVEKAYSEANKIYETKNKSIIEAIERGKVVEEIKNMADIISSISSQTNLLALNASIEAARAGEKGKGFSVVAEEIRKLAEESNNTVEKIHKMVKDIKNAFYNLSENSSDILVYINDSVKKEHLMFIDTTKEFEQDSRFISNMSENIANMTGAINNAVFGVKESIHTLSVKTQTSADNSGEILNNVNEVSHGMEQISLNAINQAQLAQRLNEIIQRFEI